MVALVGALGGFHLPQQAVHLFDRELAVGAHRAVAGHGRQQFVALFGQEARHAHAGQVAQHGAGQRLDVEMVVVVVCDQYGIDRRQVVEGDARRVDALRPHEAEGAGALGIDRVDQEVEPGDLVKKRGMAEMDDARPVDACRRLVLRRRLIGGGKGLALALAGLPAQHVDQPLADGAPVAEDEAVEMVADRPLVIGVARAGDRRPGGTRRGQQRAEPDEGKKLAAIHSPREVGRGAASSRPPAPLPAALGCQLLPERIATVAMPAPISSVPPALLNRPIARGLRTTARAREAISA